MVRFIKFFIYSILILFVILVFLAIFLSKIGLETKRFNPLIIEQVKKYNENLNLDINKVKIYISIDSLTNPKIRISTKNPILILGRNKIELKSIDTRIDILSYFKDNFIIEEFEIWTKNNKIKDLISIASLEQSSLIIYNVFIKGGYASINSSIKFDENGKITDYKLSGQVKDVKLKYNEKYSFGNINFDFTHQKNETSIKNANFYHKKIKLLSDKIIIVTDFDDKKIVTGDIRIEKNTINLKLFKDIFENNLYFVDDQEITVEIKNKFSFTLQKEKIKALKHLSKIDLDSVSLKPKINLLKNYFSNYNDSILLKNNSITLKYENKNLNIEGESDYSLGASFDKIEYKINKKNNNYDFLTLINFDSNLIKIKPISYSKEKNKKSNLKLKGSYKKNKVKFNEIIYNEGSNFFEVKDLILNNKFKIRDLKKVKASYLNTNNKKSEFDIKKDSTHYNLNGLSFDSYKLINDMLLSDNDKSFLDNFDLKDGTKLNININKVFLDEENFSKNLFGELIFKNNKVHSLNLTSEFENNEKFNLDVKTLKNKQKITSFYSDNAEPFIKHYKFIKGFKKGKIDFYSIKENSISNSKLNIFDFKVKEMPALTKLLSLASLQGIADLMTGEGIRFNEFEMNFNNKNKLMTINEIYALGPAISILMSGYVESNKLISLRGTLVPATTLNKVVGSLPLIGNILVGKKTGEGVFGVSFKIKGPPKKLKTTVNPIKTLTPRFITRTLEKVKKPN
ncbi:MAG TPA: AsmA-like C-terminal region-containing protein [Candidatus Pelagibacter bacterium]|jgi:hypothetical protein|nr:hypothetical protein [Pelagibacteraceae bacterium]HJN84176.1 AsmA-like C-terminal region-containing protein [Candidatus Pelagibacter bacterium]|tara:strand:+ start:323 stop:2539 length:2217 start_codon:yes stop_codon:yes gene_type:complete